MKIQTTKSMLLTAAFLLSTTSCHDSSSADTAPEEKTQQIDSNDAAGDSDDSIFVSDTYEAVEPCKKWDFSSTPAVKLLEESGIEVSIDCDSINQQTSSYESSLAQYKNRFIPDLLEGLSSEHERILSLDLVPTKIEISTFAKRAYGTGTWTLPASSEGDRVTYFVDRESTFQKVETDLFAGKIFLTTGTNGSAASVDVNFGQWHKTEFSVAAGKLKLIKEALLARQDDVQIISLPLSTNQTASPFNLDYNSHEKVLQLPYELNEDVLAYFIEKIVPLKRRVQNDVGSAALTLSLYDILSNDESSSLQRAGGEVKPQAFEKYADFLERLLEVSKSLGQVSKEFKVRVIFFAKARQSAFGTRHTLSDGVLTIFAVEQSLFSSTLFNADDLKGCFEHALDHDGYFDSSECDASFN
ncbi:hypothetical protein N9D31_02405 [Oligoflexaceae bacterium]|nr:hypothetical protein [Oligoflexaceae bacterium]